MKRTSFFLLLLIPFLTFCKKEKPKQTGLCPDSDFCVLSKTPLLSQSASSLPPIIKQKSGISSITRDQGWCAPVSSAIGIAGLVRETSSTVKFNNNFDQFRNFSKAWSTNSRTKKYGVSIYNIGEKMDTNWKDGGTYSHKKVEAFESIKKAIRGPTNFSIGHEDQSLSRWTTVTNQDIVDIFKKHKPAFAVSWGVYKKSGTIYRRNGGHALIINGYEDGYLKVYDPWGKIYNINIVEANGGGINGRAEIRHVSGDRGFVKSYTGADKKILFDGYNYLYAHKK